MLSVDRCRSRLLCRCAGLAECRHGGELGGQGPLLERGEVNKGPKAGQRGVFCLSKRLRHGPFIPGRRLTRVIMSPQPPVPFADFEFSFDPSISQFFPPPAPVSVPSSADLFSQSETTDLLGFLDNFNWEFDPDPVSNAYSQPPRVLPPYSNLHASTSPDPSTPTAGGRVTRSAASRTRPNSTDARSSATRTRGTPHESNSYSATPNQPRTKSLLTTPQKRLNHIMSEQKRRNAIRDGYAQLITLLAPAGAPGLGMPTRGRPKGSGSRGKGKTKGKSGVLFRAVEYVKWLEEGRDALLEEVLRAEAAAGIRHY